MRLPLIAAATLFAAGNVLALSGPSMAVDPPLPLDGDVVGLPSPPPYLDPAKRVAVSSDGPGYNLLDFGDHRPRDAKSYTIKLATNGSIGNIEEMRANLVTAAQQLGPISGVSITVSSGTISPRDPNPGEIIVSPQPNSQCGSGAAACASPWDVDYDSAPGYAIIRSGFIRMLGTTFDYSEVNQTHVVAHELGHVLGLHHYDGTYGGQYQVMHSGAAGYTSTGGTYKSGDINGFEYLAPFSDAARVIGGEYADVDGNGKGDLIARASDGTLYVYPGDGDVTGPFALATRRTIGTGWNAFSRLRAGDVTGDGNADLLAQKANGDLFLYQGTGDIDHPYTGAGSAQIGSAFDNFVSLNLGDLDADGDADLVAMDEYGKLFKYPSNGSATSPFSLATRVQIGHGFAGFRSLSLGDLNADGRAELLAAKSDGSLLAYVNSGSLTAPYSGSSVNTIGASGWAGFTRLLAGDINNDDKADLIALQSSGALWSYRGSGSLTSPFNSTNRWQIGTGWAGFTALT